MNEPTKKMLSREQLRTVQRLHPDGKLTLKDAERFTEADRRRKAKLARQAKGMVHG